MVDVTHQRHANLFGDLQRDVEGGCTLLAEA